MKDNKLGKHLKQVRQDRGLTSEKLSELCSINSTYLRQIESGTKTPSLPVFITLCNVLKISPDYLLRDQLISNDISTIHELTELWKKSSPTQQEIASIMIRELLNYTVQS